MRAVPVSFAAAAALLATSCVFVVHDHDDEGPEHAVVSVASESRGSGTSVREERDVAAFTRIEAGGAIRVAARVGAEHALAVTADDNLIARVRADVRDGALRLSMAPGAYELRTPIVVDVACARLDAVELDGAAHADVRGLDGGSFAVRIGGAAGATLAGRVEELRAELRGGSQLSAYELEAQRVAASLADGSQGEVTARADLRADVTDGAQLSFRGDPPRVATEASDGARVVDAGARSDS